MRNRHLRGLAALLIPGLVFTACGTTAPSSSSVAGSPGAGSSAQTSQPPASDQRIVFASRETIDNAFAVETDDAYTLNSIGVGETLARTNFEGELEPNLATEWTRTGDLTWEFTLRDGVTFHDGTPFNAEAVAFSLTHLLGVEAPARSFNPTTFTSVEAVGTNVVRVTSTASNTLVPFYLASPSTIILSEKAYAGDQIDPTEAGTGPFVVKSTNLPQSLSLDRNEDYWGGPVALAGAEVRFIPDGGTRATLVQTGEVQLADNMPIAAVPTLEGDPNVSVVRGDLSRTNTAYLNNKKAPLSDVRVRQAVQAAIDVNAISNEVLEGAVTPAIGPFAPNAPWAPPGAQPIPRDVDKAKALLAEAGIAPGSLTLSIWAYPGRPELPDVAVTIQAMLLEAGINADVRVADYAALEPDVLAGNFDIMLLSRGYLVDINDPIGYLRSDYSCEGTYNLSHYCDPAVDAQLDAVLQKENPEDRYPVYTELATKLQAEAVDVFLYHPQEISAMSAKLQGYRIHPLQHFVLTPELSISK